MREVRGDVILRADVHRVHDLDPGVGELPANGEPEVEGETIAPRMEQRLGTVAEAARSEAFPHDLGAPGVDLVAAGSDRRPDGRAPVARLNAAGGERIAEGADDVPRRPLPPPVRD